MTDTETQSADRQRALNAASGAASKRLRLAHPEEFNKFMAEEATRRNQPWTPKPTKEQKAEAEFRRLLDENPHLAEQIAAEAVRRMPEAPPVDPA